MRIMIEKMKTMKMKEKMTIRNSELQRGYTRSQWIKLGKEILTPKRS